MESQENLNEEYTIILSNALSYIFKSGEGVVVPTPNGGKSVVFKNGNNISISPVENDLPLGTFVNINFDA